MNPVCAVHLIPINFSDPHDLLLTSAFRLYGWAIEPRILRKLPKSCGF